MVVCAALMHPPVRHSIRTIGSAGDADEIVMAASPTAPAIPPADMTSIETRDPNRAMATLPASAPATPPRLNAVMPVLAVPASKPALVSSDVSQLKPR